MKKLLGILLLTAVTTGYSQSIPGDIPATLKNSSTGCTPALNAVCTTQLVKFTEKQYWNGNNSNNLGAGAIWKFYNVATDVVSGAQVNATVKVEYTVNANLTNIDNGSTDLFSPLIQPSSKLSNASKAGYVQFVITFYKNKITGTSNKWNDGNYAELIQLKDLNYVHYDIDGNHNNSYSFRETGLVKELSSGNPAIFANANSELNAYNYFGDGSNWKGYVGSDEERDGVSNCAEVVASFKFSGSYSSVTVRMGYNYTRKTGNGMNDTPNPREYGSTFSCFQFPSLVYLPVKFEDVQTQIIYK